MERNNMEQKVDFIYNMYMGRAYGMLLLAALFALGYAGVKIKDIWEWHLLRKQVREDQEKLDREQAKPQDYRERDKWYGRR